MKRKIRKKRQIRLQLFIKQKEHSFDDVLNRLLEEDLKSHPYYYFSELSFYVLIYVGFHYGWESRKPKKIIFLYDRMTKKIEYSRCIYNFNENDVRSTSYNVSFHKLGSEVIVENVYIDDMFSCNPMNPDVIYDCGYYEIFIKTGSEKRFLFIKAPNASKYEPYRWLFNLVNKIIVECN